MGFDLYAGEYISQTTWASRQAFKDWTQSQNVSVQQVLKPQVPACVQQFLYLQYSSPKHMAPVKGSKTRSQNMGASEQAWQNCWMAHLSPDSMKP